MRRSPDFARIPDVDVGSDDGRVDAKGKHVSTGVVLFDDGGRIWIYEPRNHYGGYQHTFPKGRLEPGLTRQQNAHKELFEETGLPGKITGVVGDFRGDTTMTRYYIGVRTGGKATCGAETQAVKLVTREQAKTLLNRQRDKDVLKALDAATTPSPEEVSKIQRASTAMRSIDGVEDACGF